MSWSLILALSSATAVLCAATLSYYDGTLFPWQMMTKYPGFSFSFIANGAMWGDLFLVTSALYVIGKYAGKWTDGEMLLALVVAFAVSAAMHYFVYLQGKLPDSLAGGGRPISPAGWIHVVYFGGALAAIELFYVRSQATTSDVIVVSALLFLHLIVANHIPLQLLNNRYHFRWCPSSIAWESSSLYTTIGACSLLTVVTGLKLWLK